MACKYIFGILLLPADPELNEFIFTKNIYLGVTCEK